MTLYLNELQTLNLLTMQLIIHDFPTNSTLQMTLFPQRSILFLFRTFNVTFEAWRYYILFSYFNNVVNIQQISFHTEYTLFYGNRHCNLYGTLHTTPRSVYRGYPQTVLHSTSGWRGQRNVLCHLDGILKTMGWTNRLLACHTFPLSCRISIQFPCSCAICNLHHMAVEVTSTTYCNRLVQLHIHLDFCSNIQPTSTSAQGLFAHS